MWDGRAELLGTITETIERAWASFEHPRPAEPKPDPDLLARLTEPLPQSPADAAESLEDAVAVLESSISPGRPLFLAYIGSSTLEAGVLAGALMQVYDVNLAATAGSADQLDRQAVQWMGEFLGYPVADGHFTSGGQTSNLTGVLAAREHVLPGSRKHGMAGVRAAVYGSDEAHHSNERAIETAGLGSESLRRIPLDEDHRIRIDALRRAIEADVAAGVKPLMVIANAGTTLTGAVDDLWAIADLCEEFGMWMHVDGAYGAPAAASPKVAHLFRGLERADSVTIDAHKWMGMPKSCSALLTKHPNALLRAFGHDEKYMLHEEESANPVDRTFEYSRPFRSLKVWLAFRLYGAQQYREWIDETLENAKLFTEAVRANSSFELLHEPQLSTLCFRSVLVPEDQRNDFNERLARAIQQDGRVYLAPATVDGTVCLRVCFVNFRTSPDDVQYAVDVIDEIANRLVTEQ